jgi:hypothetical protein
MASVTHGTDFRDGNVSVGRQALRREVNQQIRERGGPEPGPLDIFCECGRPGCNQRVVVSVEAYDELRRVPTWFVVKRGHDGMADRIVVERDEFVILEKSGRSGVEAVALERAARSR